MVSLPLHAKYDVFFFQRSETSNWGKRTWLFTVLKQNLTQVAPEQHSSLAFQGLLWMGFPSVCLERNLPECNKKDIQFLGFWEGVFRTKECYEVRDEGCVLTELKFSWASMMLKWMELIGQINLILILFLYQPEIIWNLIGLRMTSRARHGMLKNFKRLGWFS